MLGRLTIWVAMGLLTTSCGGGGTASGTVTVGQVCDSTGMAFCNRVAACQLGTFSDCFNAFKPTCCTAATSCAQVETGMTAALLNAYETACDAAFQSEACADVEARTVPAACAMAP